MINHSPHNRQEINISTTQNEKKLNHQIKRKLLPYFNTQKLSEQEFETQICAEKTKGGCINILFNLMKNSPTHTDVAESYWLSRKSSHKNFESESFKIFSSQSRFAKTLESLRGIAFKGRVKRNLTLSLYLIFLPQSGAHRIMKLCPMS